MPKTLIELRDKARKLYREKKIYRNTVDYAEQLAAGTRKLGKGVQDRKQYQASLSLEGLSY